MPIFKLLGLVILLLSSTFLGVGAAKSLRYRCGKLNSICISLESLAGYISNGKMELDCVLARCFKEEILTLKNEKPVINESGLTKEDAELFKEFLEGLGMQCLDGESKRISLYKGIFLKQRLEAEERANRLCRLYNSLGFLAGLSICIILI